MWRLLKTLLKLKGQYHIRRRDIQNLLVPYLTAKILRWSYQTKTPPREPRVYCWSQALIKREGWAWGKRPQFMENQLTTKTLARIKTLLYQTKIYFSTPSFALLIVGKPIMSQFVQTSHKTVNITIVLAVNQRALWLPSNALHIKPVKCNLPHHFPNRQLFTKSCPTN